MLCLTLKKHERIVIGGNIVVWLDRIKRDGSARIAVEAPRDMLILRGELIDKEKANGNDCRKGP